MWIEKSVSWNHCLATLCKAADKFFYPHLTPLKDSYIINPFHAAIKISINATAAGFICKNIFPIICKNIFPPSVQVKKIIKNKIGDIQQIYLYQIVCK